MKKPTNIDQQLRVEREVTHQLQEQLSDVRVEYCTVLKSLKEAHTLIDKHIDTAKESSIRELSLKERVSGLSNEVKELKGQLAALEEESGKDKQNLIAESNQHKKELSDLRQRLSTLQGDYASLQLSNEELESEKKHLISRKTENECILDDTKKQLNAAKEEIEIIREKYLCIEKERDELKMKYNGENKCDKEVQCDLALEEGAVLHKRLPLSQDLLESPPLKRLKSSSSEYGESETPTIASVEAQVQDTMDQIIEAATAKFIELSPEALMKETVVVDTIESDENVKGNEVELGEVKVIDVSPAPMATSTPSDVTEDNIMIQKIASHSLTLTPNKATSDSKAVSSVGLASEIKTSLMNNFPTLSKSLTATDTVTAPGSNALTEAHSKAQVAETKIPHTTSNTTAPNTSIASIASAKTHSKALGSSEVEIMFSDNDDDDDGDLIDTQLSKEIERAHSLLLNDRLKRSKYHKNKTIIK
ncbi:PREDICTED: protein bicaudal D-like [Amphimedon queenslandica]|nr:PREDICTED: protein bicaudal D-like [Amphimedon queenslandica]|eukprot:XP_019855898.1 PREDICTED: protein bicaudal D-like [Amphimedon queenslandica]